jgi:hypothetical protein
VEQGSIQPTAGNGTKTVFLWLAIVIVAVGAFQLYAREKILGIATYSENRESSSRTGYEFNYYSAGHNNVPEIVILRRVRHGDKILPAFSSEIVKIDDTSFAVTIDGAQIDVPKGGFRFFVNDETGKPREMMIDRSIGERVIRGSGYFDLENFWTEVIEPRLNL